MVLLTVSTVSWLFTCGVICSFTFLLFISGYLLQQQSVRNIQYAIRVPVATPPSQRFWLGAGIDVQDGSEHGNSRNAAGYSSLNHNDYDGKPSGRYESNLEQSIPSSSGLEEEQGEETQGNYAYLQLLSQPDLSDICSAVLFFKTLAVGKTAVQDRLFMYPQEWDSMAFTDRNISKALSILQSASTKYGIWLLPIDMSISSSQGYIPTDSKLLRLGQIQFMQYDGVLYLRTPGLLLDTRKLDRMLLSRHLPRGSDINGLESYDNKAWTPMPLRAELDAFLPPAYLITVKNLGAHVEARTHIPNAALPAFRGLITGPDTEDPNLPAYVFFEHDKEGYVRWEGNRWFGVWRAQQHQVCSGFDLDNNLE